MIKILKSNKLDITPPKFLCDGNLTEHLTNYPQFSHLNVFNTTCLCGRPGSGKTSMLISILNQKGDNKIYHKVFNKIYVIMPAQSRASLKDNIFEKHNPSRLYDELNLQNLQAIYDEVEENSKDKKTSLIIYDDVGSILKQNDIQMLLKKLSYNRRHLKVCQMFLIQSWKSTPLQIRKLYSNLILFKPNKSEFETIVEETIEQEKDVALALMDLYKDPHDYLFINITKQEIFLNQNKIEITDDD